MQLDLLSYREISDCPTDQEWIEIVVPEQVVGCIISSAAGRAR
ncbi:hypothetical protein ABIA39_000988 [Nocardia sp. GAS34]|jgi:hypothetical protein